MLVPLSWLRDYVDFEPDAATLAHDLTMSGTKIEKVQTKAPEFEGVFVGKVLEQRPHPGADKLSLCLVDVGGERLRIVCGAPNVRAGQTVAVARAGARLAGGVKIRKSKIRGEVSEGMICSRRELGLGEEADGILVLDATAPSGADFGPLVGGTDSILEAEITPNRPDCLSIIGIAREVAALYGRELRLPRLWQAPAGEALAPCPVRIEIESAADCGRYLGRVVRGVTVADSPAWLQARLRAVGLQPINNLVDITNFVLFETGQPLHAFDLDALRGARLVVRRARAGEKLRALDGVERALDAGILVIADADRPVAVAGVIGGTDTAVSPETRCLLLESACFDPGVVRAGRRRLGLDTDASYRFERQADIEAVRWAADRATQLLVELAGGEVQEAERDVYPAPYRPATLRLRIERANRLVGTRLDSDTVTGLLRRLQLEVEPRGAAEVEVRVPSFRRDLHAEIDLVEEVARVFGYANIESDTLPPAPLVYREEPHDAFVTRLRDFMVGRGFFEVRASAFMERGDPERLGLPEADPRRREVRLRNPIVASLGTMRTTLLPGMLRILRHNRHHDQEQLRFVQLDRVFIDVPGPYPGLPSEPERLLALASGPAEPPTWAERGRDHDLFDLKGDLGALLGHLGVDTRCTYGYTDSFLDVATSFLITGTYGVIGGGGAVRAEVLQAFDLEPPIFLFEIDIELLEKHLPGRRLYRELPRFPAAKRDLSLVVPGNVTYQEIHTAVVGAGGPHLESVQCFDVFAGGTLGPGERSLGIRLRFRSPQQTLSDAAVDGHVESIVRRLAEALQVHLRAG